MFYDSHIILYVINTTLVQICYNKKMNKKYEESIKLHKKHGGKLEVKSKIPLKNKKDFLTYFIIKFD